MPAQEEQVIIDIVVRNDDAIKRIRTIKNEIADLRDEMEELDVSTEQDAKRFRELTKQVEDLTKENKILKKTISDNKKELDSQVGSIRNMRLELSNLKKEYIGLSEEQRKSEGGKAMAAQILEITNNLKAAEAEIGLFQRNVGDYENAVKRALSTNTAFGKTFEFLQANAGNLPGVFKAATTAVANFGKQLLVLLANPIVLTIAAIVGAVTALVAIFNKAINVAKGNEEQFYKLQQIMQPIRVIGDAITRTFEKLAETFINVASSVMKGVTAFTDFLGITKNLSSETEKYIQLEKDRYNLSVKTRQANEDDAKDALRIAELRDKAAKKDKYNAQERIKYLDEAIAIEKERAAVATQLAEENLRILEEEASRTKNAAEMEDRLSAARIAVTQATTAKLQKTRELNAQRVEALKSDQAQAKALADKQKQIEEQTRANTLAATQKLRETQLSLLEEGLEKERQLLNASYEKQKEDLQLKLTNDKNLTEEARKALSASILNLENKRQEEEKKLELSNLDDILAAELARIQTQQDAIKAGTEQAYSLQIDSLKKQREAAINANLQLTEEMRISEADINAKYDKMESDLRDKRLKEVADKQSKALQVEWQNRILQVQKGSQEESQLRVQAAQAEYDAIANIDEETKKAMYETDAEYTNAVLQSRAALVDAQQQYSQSLLEANVVMLSAVSELGDAFGTLFETFAEDNEQLAAFAKTIALFNIGLATAEAISKGIAAANSVPFPGNIAAMITTMAAVLTNIAKAKKLISEQSNPKAPSFGDGGVIEGAPHSQGGVNINAEGGEGVINKASMSNPTLRSIASAVNVAGGGIPFIGAYPLASAPSYGMDSESIRTIVRETLDGMPAPVVSVKEITRVQNSVRVQENTAKR